MAIKLVSFYYGTQAEFQSLVSLVEGALYFIEDTGRIYRGSLENDTVVAKDVTNDVILVNTLPQVGVPNKIYIVKISPEVATTGVDFWWDAKFWDSTTASYQSIIHHLTPNEVLAKYLASDIVDQLQNSHPVAMLPSERTKLSGIAAGAEVNVQPDWNQSNATLDDYIKNKPIISNDASSIVPGSTTPRTLPDTNAIYNYLLGFIPNTGSSTTIHDLYLAYTGDTHHLEGFDLYDFTSADKSKLDGIAAGAEVNVQSDWDQGDTTADDYIKNKPIIDTSALFTTDDTHIPSSKFLNSYLANNYLLRANGHLTGPLFADNQNIYLGVNNTTPYIKMNSITGAIEFYTA